MSERKRVFKTQSVYASDRILQGMQSDDNAFVIEAYGRTGARVSVPATPVVPLRATNRWLLRSS